MLMGIVNVTPDSFSDGGKFYSHQTAVEHALRLEDEGADIIDIGGESTRPYSEPVSADEELRRTLPVIESLRNRTSAVLSIDTSKAIVAAAAIEAGAEIVNDVTALTGDDAMINLVRESHVGVCAMHMRGSPQTMQNDPQYADVTEEIVAYLQDRDQALVQRGIEPGRICLDPGIGFGKTHEHNWTLVRRCAEFHRLGRPLLVGHSRKGFVRKAVEACGKDIAAGSVGVALALALQGIQIIRVHDVAATRSALETFLRSRS